MSLRLKFAVAMVALAAGATIAVGLVSYVSTERRLRDEVDASLVAAAERVFAAPRTPLGRGPLPGSDDDGDDFGRIRSLTQILVQVVASDGTVVRAPRSGLLPVSERDIEMATSVEIEAPVRLDVVIDGEPFRVLTVDLEGGVAQFARSLAETERLLDSIRNRTVGIVVVSSALAALLGVLIAQQVTRRLIRLTEAATAVAESGDLEVSVPVEGNDETSRLGRAFNEMLASLASSRRSQRQLVQDAGHELRTPLTSLRTNVAVMQRFEQLSPQSRAQLLADLESETRELTELVNEIVELATEQRDDEPVVPVELGGLAESVVERARRRTGRTVLIVRDAALVAGRPHALERAINNLVENALKFSDGLVEVTVRDGSVSVSDRGPGLGSTDRSKLFDRFYRSAEARAMPGSGLGLAIVREVAERHGGTVDASDRPGGGAIIGFSVPVLEPSDDRASSGGSAGPGTHGSD
ncbi:MAG: hypothetical protein RI958_2604 [Actinomycetota bacterium]|jgi:two-component system sensor histidine kinase MprB